MNFIDESLDPLIFRLYCENGSWDFEAENNRENNVTRLFFSCR